MASLRPARFVPPVAMLAVVALAGCGGGDAVTSYTVSRTTEKGAATAATPAATEYRILGAIFPADNPVWYFKVAGKTAELAKYEADFDKFLASVKLPPNNAVPDFKLPDGWTRGGRRDVSSMGVTVTFDETVKFGPHELTISQAQGGALQNVNRWANQQLGLPPVKPGDMNRYTREIAADGVKGLRVDIQGPNDPSARRGPMMGGKR